MFAAAQAAGMQMPGAAPGMGSTAPANPTAPGATTLPGMPQATGPTAAPAAGAPLTPDEQEAVSRLQELIGGDRERALQAFLTCNRNEEMAASFLFEEMEADQEDD